MNELQYNFCKNMYNINNVQIQTTVTNLSRRNRSVAMSGKTVSQNTRFSEASQDIFLLLKFYTELQSSCGHCCGNFTDLPIQVKHQAEHLPTLIIPRNCTNIFPSKYYFQKHTKAVTYYVKSS